MLIRPAIARDIPTLEMLAKALPTAAHWSSAQYSDLFTGPARCVLLLEEDGAIHGFIVASATNPEWEIENFAIAKSHQRRGLASQLVRALISQAKESAAAAIVLEVRASNESAQSFYRAHSFREVGQLLQQPDGRRDPLQSRDKRLAASERICAPTQPSRLQLHRSAQEICFEV